MEINVVDCGDPYIGLKVPQVLEGLGQVVLKMHPGDGMVAKMIDDVIKQAGSPGNLTVLRLYSHGNEGGINITSGDWVREAKDRDGTDVYVRCTPSLKDKSCVPLTQDAQGSSISMKSLEKLKPTLQRLTPYFAPGARVELQGCIIAQGDLGKSFMVELAKLWGVTVQASTKELPLGSVQFSGSVFAAMPDGSIKEVTATEIPKLNATKPLPAGLNPATNGRPMPAVKLKEYNH
jgi:hypothetical protein